MRPHERRILSQPHLQQHGADPGIEEAGGELGRHHPKISRNGRNVGVVFTGFWAAVAALNGYAFWSALG